MTDDRVREVALQYFDSGSLSNSLVKYFTDEKTFLEQAQEILMKLMQGSSLSDSEVMLVSTDEDFYKELSFEE